MQIEHFILDYLAFHSKCCCFLCVFFSLFWNLWEWCYCVSSCLYAIL